MGPELQSRMVTLSEKVRGQKWVVADLQWGCWFDTPYVDPYISDCRYIYNLLFFFLMFLVVPYISWWCWCSITTVQRCCQGPGVFLLCIWIVHTMSDDDSQRRVFSGETTNQLAPGKGAILVVEKGTSYRWFIHTVAPFFFGLSLLLLIFPSAPCMEYVPTFEQNRPGL